MKNYSISLALLLAAFSVSSAFADTTQDSNTCAILFTSSQFDGHSLQIPAGSAIADLRDYSVKHECGVNWNNEAGSMLVMPGCEATVYQYLYFDVNYETGRQMGGQIRNFPNDGPRVRHIDFAQYGFNDLLSSLQCNCQSQ